MPLLRLMQEDSPISSTTWQTFPLKEGWSRYTMKNKHICSHHFTFSKITILANSQDTDTWQMLLKNAIWKYITFFLK